MIRPRYGPPALPFLSGLADAQARRAKVVAFPDRGGRRHDAGACHVCVAPVVSDDIAKRMVHPARRAVANAINRTGLSTRN